MFEVNYYPNKNERNLIFMARHLAVTSNVKKGKHCAFAIDKTGKVVDIYVNTQEMHAEYGLMKLTKNIPVDRVIVVRARRVDNTLTNSKPCLKCSQSMDNAGVKSCVFSIHENRFSLINYN